MAKSELSNKEQVSEFIAKLEQPILDTTLFLKETILETDAEIATYIKWNSVAFYYSGEMIPFDPKEYKRDLLVLNIQRRGHLLMVFPTGAKIEDGSGFLEGTYLDGRKIATIKNLEYAKTHKQDLQNAIKDWLSKIEK